MFKPAKSLSDYNLVNQLTWFLMAFQAGFINAGGFLSCHRFVTHTTGFATHFGVEAATGNIHSALGMLSVPIFFLFGSMISALFIDRNYVLNRYPRYDIIFASMSAILLAISLMGYLGYFGLFGEDLSLSGDYILLVLLCLCSGLQNALVTSASGAVVRTTHLTGITTDLGIGITKVLWGQNSNAAQRANESRANQVRMGLIGSFILGSCIGAFIFLSLNYLGFLLPALISISLTGASVAIARIRKKQQEGKHV